MSFTQQPRLGVAVLVFDGLGRLLLGRRAKDPNRGKWVIPGGKVEWGESWRTTAVREIAEETGLSIRLGVSVRPYVYEILGEDEHRVILFVPAYDYEGVPVASSDLSEVRFFGKLELPDDISPHVRRVLEEILGWPLG